MHPALRTISAALLLAASSAHALGPTANAQDGRRGSKESEPSRLRAGEVEIEYIAHACFRIRSPSGKRILIDPYASRVWLGYDFPAGLEADAVLITHPHYDHDAGRWMDLDTSWMNKLEVLDKPGKTELGDFHITGIAGKHADPWGKEFGQKNTIWLIDVAGLRIVHLGDNGPLSEKNVAELGRVDVLMAPIDAKEHILHADELAAIRTALHPTILIPMHYRLPDLEREEGDPEALGEIEPWLEHESHVRRLESHLAIFTARTLPETAEVVVFRHSPAVVPPAEEK